MNNIWQVIKITFIEGIRNRVLYGIAFLVISILLLNIAVSSLFSFEIGKVMIDISFAALSIGGLSIVFLGIGLLSKDIHDKTVCMIICRPITRSEYILGKFGGLFFLIISIMAILSAFTIISFILSTNYIDNFELPRNFGWAKVALCISFNLISLLVIMSFSFFFTIISSSIYLSMMFTFSIYIIGHSIETIVKLLLKGEFVDSGTINIFLLKIVSWVFPNLSAFDLKQSLSYGLTLDSSYLLWTSLYGISYSSIMIFITLYVFQRREIC